MLHNQNNKHVSTRESKKSSSSNLETETEKKEELDPIKKNLIELMGDSNPSPFQLRLLN